ncbi:hypothetical protein, partial [Gilliamella apis]|uniref:hypothetical protein n=1 Tax=Gilliamella apis TaxID=1970738 RepID=UPI001C2CB537
MELADVITNVSDLLDGFLVSKTPFLKIFYSLSFGRLLFCGCFYTAITSELRGLAPTLFTISRGDHASGHDVTAFCLRSLLTLLAKH